MPSEKSMQSARALIHRHDETTCCSRLIVDTAAAIDEAVAEEKERADSNYASCERVKAKFEASFNEARELREQLEFYRTARARGEEAEDKC